MPHHHINLDHLSATPLLPECWEAMLPYFQENYGNPTALHHQGVRARQALQKARIQMANFLQAKEPDEIFFTSCGTEAANLALQGIVEEGHRLQKKHIVVSEIEHPALLHTLAFLEANGFESTRIPVDSEGRVTPQALQKALTPHTLMVATHLAHADLGTIQPIRELTALAHKQGAFFYCDAGAAAGWHPVNVYELNVDLLSLSPYRFYGPKGVGILYKKRGTPLHPLLYGGQQENGLRPGTENIPAIVGAGCAAEIAQQKLAQRIQKVSLLQRQLLTGLQEHVLDLHLHGPIPGPERLPHTLNLSPAFLEGEAIALALDLKGIAVHAGASCVNKALKIPPALRAIGVSPEIAQASLILSLGESTTPEAIAYTLTTFPQVIHRLRQLSPRL